MNSKSVRKSFVKLDPKVFENDTSYKNVLAKNNPTPHASIELISNIDQDEFGEKISHHQRKNSQSSDSTCSSSSSSYTEQMNLYSDFEPQSKMEIVNQFNIKNKNIFNHPRVFQIVTEFWEKGDFDQIKNQKIKYNTTNIFQE